MKRVNADPDGREPDWAGLERLTKTALAAYRAASTDQAMVAQIDAVVVTELYFTGVGYYADLAVSAELPPLANPPDFPFYPGYADAGDERLSLKLWFEARRHLRSLEVYIVDDVEFSTAADYRVWFD